jgi:OmpA-OmpF porin, OOP family
MYLRRVLLAWLILPVAIAMAQEMEITAELMNRVGTEVSHKGDQISGRVLSPSSLQGDVLEGRISNVRSGGKMGGTAVLTLGFDILRHGGQAIPISAQVRSISNSKGQLNADEEGRVIRGSMGNVGKAAGGTGAGALIGGIAGGGRGAAIGALAGGAVSIALIEIAADGPSVKLDPGSRVIVSARSRSGPPLASLQANATQPPPAPAQAPAPSAPAATPMYQAAAAGTPPAQPPVAAPVQSSATAVAAAPAASQPNLTEIKSDFVPGEKAVFFDDFSDMAGDDPPPHWKVRGGVAALKVGGGVRQLTMVNDGTTLAPNFNTLPANFTLEAEVQYENPNRNRIHFYFRDAARKELLQVETRADFGRLFWWLEAGSEMLAKGDYVSNYTQPDRYALWVQNGRIRLYANGTRLADVNQVKLPGLATFDVRTDVGAPNKSMAVGLRMVRLAESSPDFSQMISSSGRYVTHGILFDTDSDRLKPESGPVIKLIARGLETNPALKLLIEGHTDSVGNADHNLDLSRRRAEAVKAVLASQFSVDASRLTTAGLGATKPIESNDTPSGRVQNRRVELVKQ